MRMTIKKLKKGSHVTIVALGDSITQNSIHNRGHMNWVSLLDEAIKETYGNETCCVINSGIGGSNFSSAFQRLERDVLRLNPDLVILALGMNDASKGIAYLPQFKKEVLDMIEKIRRVCGSEILVRTPNPIVAETAKTCTTAAPGEVFEDKNRPLAEYSKALQEVARESNCQIVDHYSLWVNAGSAIAQTPPSKFYEKSAYQGRLWPRMANSTHPGPLGQLVFYQELAPLFELPTFFPWENAR